MIGGIYTGLSAACWLTGTLLLAKLLVGSLDHRLAARRLSRLAGLHRAEEWRQPAWFRALTEAIELADLKLSAGSLLTGCAGLAVCTYFSAGGVIRLLQMRYALDADQAISPDNPLLCAAAALLVGGLPLFAVFFQLQRKRQAMALEMISAVQNLIGTYGANLTLGDWLRKAERTMPGSLRAEWSRLCLSVRTRSAKDALYDFSRRLGIDWADDLADMLLVRAEYGHDVTGSLHKLVRDMQTAKSNEQKRQAAISVYRIGTVFMTGAAFFVIGFNIHADRNNYRYYFLQPAGRAIVTVSLVILFASMIVVIVSGRKRI